MTAAYAGTPFNLSGRVALVAGAAGLLGREFTKALVQAGAKVALLDRDEAQVSALATELGGALGVGCDITDEASIDRAIATITARLGGRIDVLVNSAAIDAKFDPGADTSRFTRFTQFPREQWEQSVNVNLTGLFLLTQRVCAVMEKTGEGSIINIGSNYGLVGPDQRIYKKPGQDAQTYKPPVYSVCKAGILGFTTYLAAYYAGTKIRVNTLTPAGVFNNHEPGFEKNYADRTILRRMSQKGEYAGAVVFLASDASSYMTGANLVIDGGWTAL
jgi:2-deoxy-D-gluconate 3-dehydrogenase